LQKRPPLDVVDYQQLTQRRFERVREVASPLEHPEGLSGKASPSGCAACDVIALGGSQAWTEPAAERSTERFACKSRRACSTLRCHVGDARIKAAP
jgi:hypothetical protein